MELVSQPFPSPAVFDGTPTPLRGQGPHETRNCYPSVAWSTTTPGPIVDERATRFRYWPLDDAGLAFCRSAIRATRFSFSACTSKFALPMVQWTMPALSTRYVTWPAFAFLTAVATSGVTVP